MPHLTWNDTPDKVSLIMAPTSIERILSHCDLLCDIMNHLQKPFASLR